MEDKKDEDVCLDWRLSWRVRRGALARACKAELPTSILTLRFTNFIDELIEHDEPELMMACLERCGHLVKMDDQRIYTAKSREMVRFLLGHRLDQTKNEVWRKEDPLPLFGARTLSALEGFVIHGGINIDAIMERDPDLPNWTFTHGFFGKTLLEVFIDATANPMPNGIEIRLFEARSQPQRCAVRLVFLGASLFRPCDMPGARWTTPLKLLRQNGHSERSSLDLFHALVEACQDRREQIRRTLQSYILPDLHAIVADFYDIQSSDLA